ncbi:MAG: metallopeptidase TldD-related protein [Fibrobacterota bacterium]|nr:metallopeptidase TldD-related protein [Fibrobacterota bacterium]
MNGSMDRMRTLLRGLSTSLGLLLALLAGPQAAIAKESAAPSPQPDAPMEIPGPPPPSFGSSNISDSSVDGSPVLKAMGSEVKRSMDSLRIKGRPRPYFLSYLLWDVESIHMQASLGSCEMSEVDRQHLLDVDLRVGDFKEDNSNFSGGIVFGPRLRLPLPQENDTNLLRLSLWAATDAKYKVAVELLAQKRAFLANHSGSDSLPDFSRQKSLQRFRRETKSPPDTAKTIAFGKDLSRYLGEFKWLMESRVGYQYYYTTFYYVDSDGARFIETVKEHTLTVALFTQAKDGAPLWNYLRIATRDPLTLGEGSVSLAALKDSLAPILKRMETLQSTAPLANYRGPILFEGRAAGDLLNKALLAPQSRLREPVGAGAEPNFMVSMAGRKLFPSEVTVIDAPSMAKWQGKSLFGHYLLDHQGQPAQDIVLVKEGRVQDFFLGKVPVFKAKGHASNGHWRYGGGFPGVTVLRSSKSVPEAELRTRLGSLGAEEGTGYGLIVTKTVDEDAFKLLRHPLAAQLASTDGMGGRGSFSLTPPCEVDMLDARTGKVTPVRGLSFPSIDSKTLRNIVAIGDRPHLHEPQAAISVLCPSLLFSLLDMKGSRSTQPRLPYLP